MQVTFKNPVLMEVIHIKHLIADYNKWKEILESLPNQFEMGILSINTIVNSSNSSLLDTYVQMVDSIKANALVKSEYFLRQLEERGLPKRCEIDIYPVKD